MDLNQANKTFSKMGKQAPESMGGENALIDQLQIRIFQLEALVAELALTLGEFVKDQDQCDFAKSATKERAMKMLSDVSARYDDRTRASFLFHPAQIAFLQGLGIRVESRIASDGDLAQVVFNDAADFANSRVRMFTDGLHKLLFQDEQKPDSSLSPAAAEDKPSLNKGR